MKKTLLFACLVLGLPVLACAQDTIIFRSGESVSAKVLEVGPKMIKYSQTENAEESVYSVPKHLVQKIQYENGVQYSLDAPEAAAPAGELRVVKREVMLGDRALSDGEIQSLLAREPKALSAYNGSKMGSGFGTLLTFAGSFVVGYELGGVIGGKAVDTTILVAGLGGTALGILLSHSGYARFTQSIELYNDSLNQPASGGMQLNLGLTLTGVDMTLRF